MKKQIQQFKRVLAGFMAAVMVFTLVPQTAFAEELETYVEQEETLVTKTEEVDVTETTETTDVSDEESAAEVIEDEQVVTEETVVEEVVETEEVDEVATEEPDVYYRIDLSGLSEDFECIGNSGTYDLEGDRYVESANGLYVKKDAGVNFSIKVKDAKQSEKEILISSVKVWANGLSAEDCEDFYKATDEGIGVIISKVTDNIRVEAQTTDFHKITFETDSNVEPIEVIRFSGNTEVNPTFSVTTKTGYTVDQVTCEYGKNGDKIVLVANEGVYTIVLRDAVKGINRLTDDVTVEVKAKRNDFKLSTSTAIEYGYSSYYFDNSLKSTDEPVQIDLNRDNLYIEPKAEAGKAVKEVVVSINGVDKTYSVSRKYIVIPIKDINGDVFVKEIKQVTARYSVSFCGDDYDEENYYDYYSIVSGNSIVKAGEDYDFEIKPAAKYEKVVLMYMVKGSAKKLVWNENNKYRIPTSEITGNINIIVATNDCVKAKYSVSLTKEVPDIAVKVVANNELVTLDGLKAVEGVVEYGTDYTFTVIDAKSDDRDAPKVTATCNGNLVDVKDNGNKTYTIDKKSVVGDIKITVTAATTKSYNVSISSQDNVRVTATAKAPQMKDYTFTVIPNAGYKLESVNAVINEQKVTFKKGDSENPLAGDFTIKAADVVGNIAIEVKAVKKDVKINVVDGNALVKYSNETPVSLDSDGKWTVKALEDFQFTVSNKDKYCVSEVGVQGKYYERLDADEGTFTIPASKITDDITIIVKTHVEYTLEYNEDLVSVTASTGNKAVEVADKKIKLESDAADVTITASLTNGANIPVDGKSIAGYKLDGIPVSINGLEKGKLDKNNQITIKTDAIDGAVSFAPAEIENVVLSYGDEVVDVKTNIPVDLAKYTSYKFTQYKGIEVVPVNSDNSHVNAETGVVTFTDNDAGKTVAITVKVNDQNVIYSFKVASKITGLTIKGFKDNKATQIAGEIVAYQVVPTPANADLTGLEVKVCGIPVAINPGAVFYVTAPVKPENTEISVSAQISDTVKYEGTITTTYDAVRKAVPSVALRYATDNDINITITAPKTINIEDTEGLFYEVSAKRITDKKTKATEDTPSYTNTVAVAAINELRLEVGAGKAEDYKVAVTLVQKYESDILVSAKTVEKIMSTLNPYIETKLGATKKETKLTQGDENKTIAIAKFDKKATLVDELGKTPEVVSYPGGGSGAVTVTSGTSTSVVVDVDSDAPAGKYVVRLTAAVPSGSDCVPSTFDVPITVVDRINFGKNATATAQNEWVYKPAGKVVTNTIKIVAAKGINTKQIDMELDPDSVAAGITIKNGKITIPKNYVVQSSSGVDIVKVFIRANDCDYNRSNRINTTAAFYVKSEAFAPADIYLSGESMDGKTYQYNELVTRTITVVDSTENEIDFTKYSLKSSSKNLVIDSDGEIKSVKPGKYTLTATATDGSKNKKVVKFTVGYSTKDVTVIARAMLGDGMAIIIKPGETSGINSNSAGVPIAVVISSGDNNAMNASYTVKGAKVQYKEDGDIFSALILQPTAEETVITVTNKSTKAKKTYKITNTMYKEQAAVKSPIVKNTSGKLYADMESGKSQNIELTIKNLPKLSEGEQYGILLRVDYAKMNNYEDAMKLYSAMDAPECLIEDGKVTIPIYGSNMVAGNFSFAYEIVKIDTITNTLIEYVGKPGTFKVTLNKTPKSSYKLKTSYKFGSRGAVKAGDYAVLTGNAILCTADFKNATIYNANIKGKNNNFKDYFYLNENGNLVVKSGKENVFTDKNLKDNLTGYIVYEVTDSITGATTTMTTMITCTK